MALIRKARLGDLDAVLDLWTALMQYHRDKHYIFWLEPDQERPIRVILSQRIQDPKSSLFVAEIKGELVGLLAASLKEKSIAYQYHKAGYIAETIVLEPFRNQGIGQELYDYAINWFKASKVDYVELQVAAQNPEARDFWERKGFEIATAHLVKPMHSNLTEAKKEPKD